MSERKKECLEHMIMAAYWIMSIINVLTNKLTLHQNCIFGRG
jgi:hypothetical protein